MLVKHGFLPCYSLHLECSFLIFLSQAPTRPSITTFLPQLSLTLPPHHTQLRLTLRAEGQSPQLRLQLEHVWGRLGWGLVQDVESEIRVGCAWLIPV